MGSPMSIPVWLAFFGDVLVVRDVFLCALNIPFSDVEMKDAEDSGDVEMSDGMDVVGGNVSVK